MSNLIVEPELKIRLLWWKCSNLPEDVVEVPLDPDVVPQGGGEAGVPRRDPHCLLRDHVAE